MEMFFFCPALTTCPLLIVLNIVTETKMATNHHRRCLFQPSSRSTEGKEQQLEGGQMHLEEITKSWKEELKEKKIHTSVLDLTFYFFNRTKISDWSPCQMCIVYCKRNRYFITRARTWYLLQNHRLKSQLPGLVSCQSSNLSRKPFRLLILSLRHLLIRSAMSDW